MSEIFHEILKTEDLPAGYTAKTHLIYVEIDDIAECVRQLVKIISDTSWISQLGPIGIATFQRRAERTIGSLIEIFRSLDGEITSDIGEYAVSITAGNGLGAVLNHRVFPISELWKERVTGNAGFDFHTESLQSLIAFGEAKYRKQGNPYTLAADQALEFIKQGKDQGDASDLERLSASPEAIQNLLSLERGFCIAFSLNSTDAREILLSAFRSDSIQELGKQCRELYIIGVGNAPN